MNLSELVLGKVTVSKYLSSVPTSCLITQVSYPLTEKTVPSNSCVLAVFSHLLTHALPFSCYMGGVVDNQQKSQINFYSATRDFMLSNQSMLEQATRIFVMKIDPASHECASHVIREQLFTPNTDVAFCMLDSTPNMQKVTTFRS